MECTEGNGVQKENENVEMKQEESQVIEVSPQNKDKPISGAAAAAGDEDGDAAGGDEDEDAASACWDDINENHKMEKKKKLTYMMKKQKDKRANVEADASHKPEGSTDPEFDHKSNNDRETVPTTQRVLTEYEKTRQYTKAHRDIICYPDGCHELSISLKESKEKFLQMEAEFEEKTGFKISEDYKRWDPEYDYVSNAGGLYLCRQRKPFY